MTTAPHWLEVFSNWCRAILPILAAALGYLKALDVRENRWRFAYGIVGAVLLFAFGCYSVYRLVV